MSKTKYRAKPFEALGHRFTYNKVEYADTSASIYMSMLLSDAYKALSNRQKQLYTVMKAQYFGKHKPIQDYKDLPNVTEDCFYLNFAAVQLYGLYSKNMQREFRQDKEKLCECGFIELVSSGAKTHKKSIYKYSDKWQQWHT